LSFPSADFLNCCKCKQSVHTTQIFAALPILKDLTTQGFAFDLILQIMVKILFWCLFIYFMYRLIFDLVIPVSRTASQLKRKVSEMQQQQQQAFQEQQRYQPNTAQTQQASTSTAPKKDDYIEFEELK